MVVSRLCFSIALVVFSNFCLAQNLTFGVKDKSIPEILRAIESTYGTQFSYDPSIFLNEPNRTVSFHKTSISDALASLLGGRYEFQRVDRVYVISTAVLKESKPRELVPVKRGQPVVIDTIIIHQVVTVYDTQRVIVPEIIYDTIQVRRPAESAISRPVEIKTEKLQKVFWMPLLGYQQRIVEINRNERATYNGLSVGLTRKDMLDNNFFIASSLTCSFVFQNAGYISRSTADTSKINNRRINSIKPVSLSLVGGFQRKMGRMNVGFESGVSVTYVFDADEVFQVDEEDGTTGNPAYKPFVNLIARVPMAVKFSKQNSLVISPFFETSLTKMSDVFSGMRQMVIGLNFSLLGL